MRNTLIGTAILCAVLLAAEIGYAQAPRSSANPAVRGSFGLAPFAGYLIGEKLLEGPLNSSLGGVGAALYGAQASLPLLPGASLVGTVGYASGDLEVGVPLLGGISVGENRTWLLDAALELRPDGWERRGDRFIPVVQLGGGALRREVGVMGFNARSTDFVLSAGLGADFPIVPNLSIRILAKDHYGKADFGTLGPITARTDDLHTVALSAGLRFSF